MPSARAEEENRLVRLAVRCASARQLHARAVLLGHARSSFVAAKLVHAFAGLGSLRRARAVAVALGAAANAFVWTALVRAHSKSGAAARDAVVLYAQMHRSCPRGRAAHLHRLRRAEGRGLQQSAYHAEVEHLPVRAFAPCLPASSASVATNAQHGRGEPGNNMLTRKTPTACM